MCQACCFSHWSLTSGLYFRRLRSIRSFLIESPPLPSVPGILAEKFASTRLMGEGHDAMRCRSLSRRTEYTRRPKASEGGNEGDKAVDEEKGRCFYEGSRSFRFVTTLGMSRVLNRTQETRRPRSPRRFPFSSLRDQVSADEYHCPYACRLAQHVEILLYLLRDLRV
jgi:hypothetical protein